MQSCTEKAQHLKQGQLSLNFKKKGPKVHKVKCSLNHVTPKQRPHGIQCLF